MRTSIHHGTRSSKVLSSLPEISFGVNDSPSDAQRLRTYAAQGYKVDVIFGFAGSPCTNFISSYNGNGPAKE
jgi:hypothetical protein